MKLHRCIRVAMLACGLARVAAQLSEELGDHPDDEPENEVTLLQVAHKLGRRSTERARQNVDVPSVIVDLDAEPELRWRNVTAFYKQMGVLPKGFASVRVRPEVAQLLPLLSWDEDYLREMKGYLSDLGLPESPYLDAMKLQQIGYEVSDPPYAKKESSNTTGCSALLAAMPNGTVVHGRNMDYGGEEVEVNGTKLHLTDVTIEGVFMRGGKPLYVSVLWPMIVGLHTAMRFDGWSFEQNTRWHSAREALELGMRHPSSTGYSLATRKVMETTSDFDEAIEKISNLDLLAPSYFAMAGPKPYQGAVITLDAGGEHRASTPLLTRLSNDSSVGWHLVQTNDDLNKEPLDNRRGWENWALANACQDKVSADWVMHQMTSWPLYTPMTVFTSVYIPARGYYKSFRHPENAH